MAGVKALCKTALMYALYSMWTGSSAESQSISNDDLHLCRNSKDVQAIILHCSNVLAGAKSRVALEIAHNKLGHAMMEQGRFSEAVTQFSEVIKLNPKIAGYFDNRRMAYQKSKLFTDAMADANTAVRLAPSYSFVYRGRASIYNDMADYKNAVDDFTRAIQLDTLDGGLFIARGKAFRSAHRLADAVEDFGHALEIDAKLTGAYRERGLTYKLLGRGDLALTDLNTYARISPQDFEVQTALAELSGGQPAAPSNLVDTPLAVASPAPITKNIAVRIEQNGGDASVPAKVKRDIMGFSPGMSGAETVKRAREICFTSNCALAGSVCRVERILDDIRTNPEGWKYVGDTNYGNRNYIGEMESYSSFDSHHCILRDNTGVDLQIRLTKNTKELYWVRAEISSNMKCNERINYLKNTFGVDNDYMEQDNCNVAWNFDEMKLQLENYEGNEFFVVISNDKILRKDAEEAEKLRLQTLSKPKL